MQKGSENSMSANIPAPVATVTVTNIHTITARILATKDTVGKVLAMAYIEIGGLLTQAKELVPPGEWGYYLENEVDFSHRTANNCMKLYAEYSKNPDSQTFANMPYSKAVRLLSLPEDEREEFVEKNDVENMSARQLDQAIKERNEALAAQESAEAEARDLRQQLLDAQQQAASAKSCEETWQETIDKLTAARDKAVSDAEAAKRKMQRLKDNPNIPQETIDKLAAEASEKAAADFQERLDKANEQLQAVTDAKVAAEKAAQEAQQKLAGAQNAARVSTPEAAAFAVLYPQVTEVFNKLNGCRKKVAINDPELGEKLLEKMRQLLADLQKAVE